MPLELNWPGANTLVPLPLSHSAPLRQSENHQTFVVTAEGRRGRGAEFNRDFIIRHSYAPTTFVTVGEGAASPPALAAMTYAEIVVPGVRPAIT